MSSNHCNNKIYCIQEFKDQVEKLRKSKSYSDLDRLLIEALSNKTIEQFKLGVLLNASETTPFIKKDIGGRSGYRLYYLAIIVKECIYIAFIHPKTGRDGSPNIRDNAKALFQKRIVECIKTGDLYRLNLAEKLISFERV